MVSIENTELLFSTTNLSRHLWPEVQNWNPMQRLEFLLLQPKHSSDIANCEIFIPEKKPY